jgi:hypothetical protein
MFDKLLANTRDPSDVSTEKIKAIADGVNQLTGRGDVGRHAETMSLALWAPRFLKSALDVLTLKPITGAKTWETKRIFMKEYAGAIASLTLIYTVASLFKKKDEKIEWDPRSASVGSVPYGNEKINFLGYARPLLTFLARTISGQSKTEKGMTNLREWGLWFATDEEKTKPVGYKSGYDQTALRFAQSKLHPTWGTILSLLTGKKFGGQKDQTLPGAAVDMSVPLAPRQAWEIARIEPDYDAIVVLSFLNFAGFDVKPDYSSPQVMAYEAASPEEFKKKAGSILHAATDPTASAGQSSSMAC